jgi:hypothetical protein
LEAARVPIVLSSPHTPEAATDPASDLAVCNFTANLRAIEQCQPWLSAQAKGLPSNLTWLFGRDGSLTGMLDSLRWWAGCSVPLAAARFMLKTMEVRGTVGCFLNPLHAAQLRVALDLLHQRQAVLAIVPEDQTLAMLLHAEDFSADIRAGRLWFSAGPEWESQLRGILKDQPGLPTPVEFIRPLTANPEAVNALIEPAQRVFAEVSALRGEEMKALCAGWQPARRQASQLCLLCPSEFRLWDDAALALGAMDFSSAGISVTKLDSDRPTSASPLALGSAAAHCDAILAANVFRSHLPGVIPQAMPWITWATTPRIGSAEDAGPNDRLLLADPSWQSIALQLGWDETRLEVAGWPQPPLSDQPARQLAVLADTPSLDVPKRLEEYSSQVLLWEWIRDELSRDPFLAVDNIDGYLDARRARFQIGDDGFDRSVFIDHLIMPAVQQGLARRLVRDRMPVKLFGHGWETIEGLADFHSGIISSREELTHIVSASAALVHLWPWQTGHALESMGRPIVRSRHLHEFLSDARAALNGTLALPGRPSQTISPALVARSLSRAAASSFAGMIRPKTPSTAAGRSLNSSETPIPDATLSWSGIARSP